MVNGFIKSPLNYTGGKYKLLSQLFSIFPKKIDTFVDLFCGGLNVGINVAANNIICIDKQEQLIKIFEFLQNTSYDEVFNRINAIIKKYNLSDSELNGYEFYNSDSFQGLQNYNKQQYLNLRRDYNNIENDSKEKNLLLLVLIFFGFNNQIRFNSKGLYNIPVGKRDFNKSIKNNLELFIHELKKKNISFINTCFQNYIVPDESFVYCDPPYYLTTASYNENGAWTENNEIELLNYLTDLNNRKIKFALSNVIEHQGKQHTILLEWIKKNKFLQHDIKSDYKNSNYHKKTLYKSKEILVTNYI